MIVNDVVQPPYPVLDSATARAVVFSVLNTVEPDLLEYLQTTDAIAWDALRETATGALEFTLTDNMRRATDAVDRSYHRYGCAWDIDVVLVDNLGNAFGVPYQSQEHEARFLKLVASVLAKRLGRNFDVVAHAGPRGGWHIHIEWDPR